MKGVIVSCGACAYWIEGERDGEERAGTCRRWAPRPRVERIDDNADRWTFWPQTYAADDGCAEGEPI